MNEDLAKIFQNGRENWASKFEFIPKQIVEKFIDDIYDLMNQVKQKSKGENEYYYMETKTLFLGKIYLITRKKDKNWALAAIREDSTLKRNQISDILLDIQEYNQKIEAIIGKLMKNNKELSMEEYKEAHELYVAKEQLVKISLKTDINDFISLLRNIEIKKQDPVMFETWVKAILVEIVGYYESFRYVCGFFLSIFDILEDCLLEPLENTYYNPKLNHYQDMYRYHNIPIKKNNSKFWRYKLKSLEQYIFQNEQKFEGFRNIFRWMFDKKGIREIRNAVSHGLENVAQNRLDQQQFKLEFPSISKYYTLIDLSEIRNDLFRLYWVMIIFLGFFSVE